MTETETMTGAELARVLSITPRRVRQLRDEGAFRQLPDGKYNVEECENALAVIRAGRGSSAMNAIYRETDELALEVDRDLARLARRPQAERLDAAMNGVGPKIGKLIHLLSLAAACAPEGARRDFERQHVAMLQSQIMGAMLATIGVKVATDRNTNSRHSLSSANRCS
jgi:hypothetical protein